MTLITLTDHITRQPVTVNLDRLIEMYPRPGGSGTELRFALVGDPHTGAAYTVMAREDYDALIGLINERVAPVLDAAAILAERGVTSRTLAEAADGEATHR